MSNDGSLENVEVFFDSQSFLKTTPVKPGVYDMRNAKGETLYIGKAKNLKSRLSSYFQSSGLTTKILSLTSQIAHIEIIITRSEIEALILEQNLIKEKRPKYNVCLKDDKSYPYIYLSLDEEYPGVYYQRAKFKSKKGIYFGPYHNAAAVKSSLNLLQKIFKVRQCDNRYFNNRSRPCLQYQINRCKAPCVGMISPEDYKQDVLDTKDFLDGKDQQLLRRLIKRMEEDSNQLQFEKAASVRDQINHLRKVQEYQASDQGTANVDVIGMMEDSGVVCFDILFIRSGRLLGHKHHISQVRLQDQESWLSQFIGQYYINNYQQKNYPQEIILPIKCQDGCIIQQAIKQVSNKKVVLKDSIRGHRLDWLALANDNAKENLMVYLAQKTRFKEHFQKLTQWLSLSRPIKRIECFDISHTSGEKTVGSCVVFGIDGAIKSEYRCYNIDHISSGDDYAAMEFVIGKRLGSLFNESEKMPDLLLIDGGKGQVASANKALKSLLLDIPLLGVAKGVDRKVGLERLIYKEKELALLGYESTLWMIQYIRDEAHRFAITGHRHRRQKIRNQSMLEEIPGVGAKRRSALLKFFGGRQGVMSAPIKELSKVDGINLKLATIIHEFLHS